MALWKGNGVTIVHRLPYSAVNFWAYERATQLWLQHYPPPAGVQQVSGLPTASQHLLLCLLVPFKHWCLSPLESVDLMGLLSLAGSWHSRHVEAPGSWRSSRPVRLYTGAALLCFCSAECADLLCSPFLLH